jgi:hypothetical protein
VLKKKSVQKREEKKCNVTFYSFFETKQLPVKKKTEE